MLRALEYRHPDRMPVYYHPSPAGLHVHGRKLLELFRAHPPDNHVKFDEIPQPAPRTVGPDGAYHRLETDEWGTEWEYCTFGLQGSPRKLPLADLGRLKDYRLPPPPAVGGAAFQAQRRELARIRDEYLVFGGWILVFEKLCELRPMDDVLVELYTGEAPLLGLLGRVEDWMLQSLRYELAVGREAIFFGDDWGFQTGPAISPEKFRELFAPGYARMFKEVKAQGGRVIFHSCGQLDGILDELLALGIDCLWPQANRYDPRELARKCRDHGASVLIHPDRQRLVPHGTPAEIREQIARYAEIHHGLGGGGIFYVEIENDAPFENVEALITAIAECR